MGALHDLGNLFMLGNQSGNDIQALQRANSLIGGQDLRSPTFWERREFEDRLLASRTRKLKARPGSTLKESAKSETFAQEMRAWRDEWLKDVGS